MKCGQFSHSTMAFYIITDDMYSILNEYPGIKTHISTLYKSTSKI